jgi:hypothetical protein
MTPLRMAAVTTVSTALVLYTIAAVKEWRARRATLGVCGFFTVGVTFDVTSTLLMILATQHGGVSLHGVLGYSALAAMATDTVLMWRQRSRAGEEPLGNGLHLYSRLAYVYWVVAYFTGAALVMMSRGAG